MKIYSWFKSSIALSHVAKRSDIWYIVFNSYFSHFNAFPLTAIELFQNHQQYDVLCDSFSLCLNYSYLVISRTRHIVMKPRRSDKIYNKHVVAYRVRLTWRQGKEIALMIFPNELLYVDLRNYKKVV